MKAYERSERPSADGRLRQFWQIPDTEPMIWGATAQMLRNLAVSLNAACSQMWTGCKTLGPDLPLLSGLA